MMILTLVNTAGLPTGLETRAADWGRPLGLERLHRFGDALDLHFPAEPAGWQAAATAWGVDAALQPAEHRTKRLFVTDMEMTLVRNEFLDDIAEIAGVGPQVSAITARAMNGEIAFADSLRERLGLLRGRPVALLEQAWAGRHWMPGVEPLFSGLKAHGVRTVVVSGGFHFFADRVAAHLGADAVFANDIEIADGCLTGAPKEPILGREAKQEVLEREAAALGLPLGATLTAGDGANDLPMLLRAGLGVAYHAKPAVAAAARCRVEHSDLRALLAFAGI